MCRAWETAQALSVECFGAQPYLKTSGIGIALAGVLEDNNLPQEAYEAYSAVFAHLQAVRSRLSGPERLRAVAVACKLGEMAEAYQQPPEEEEKWLVWAVEELLRTVQDSQGAAAGTDGSPLRDGEQASRTMLSELDLPGWVSKSDFGAPFEALGAFYSRVGKVE